MIKERTSVLPMKWYVIRTQTNKEKVVLERFQAEIERGFKEKVRNILIPTEKIFSVKNGKKIYKDKIVYPGYIFIETNSISEISGLSKTISGCSGFLRNRNGEIDPVKESEIKKIVNLQEENESIEVSKIWVVGERVKIIDGPFASFEGEIESKDESREKIKIAVSIFGRKTIVDLSFNQIDRLS